MWTVQWQCWCQWLSLRQLKLLFLVAPSATNVNRQANMRMMLNVPTDATATYNDQTVPFNVRTQTGLAEKSWAVTYSHQTFVYFWENCTFFIKKTKWYAATLTQAMNENENVRRDVYFSCLGVSDDAPVNLVFGLVPFRKRCDKVCMLSVCLL